MLCGLIPKKKKKSGSVAVYLNVYDIIGLTHINGYAYWLGLGVYHSGVQVHGVEYAFGAHNDDTTGVFEVEPKQCPGFTFRKSILIGRTDLGAKEVGDLMEKLSKDYSANTYHLFSKNCNHFCNDLCKLITGKPIPSWVNRLARLGRLCKCVLPVQPAVLDEVKVHPISVEIKIHDVDKNKLRSQSSRVKPSNSEPVDGIIKESKPLEADVKHEFQEEGIIGKQLPDGNFKAPDGEVQELVLDYAVTEKQCQQQDLRPADIREPGPVEAEAEVRRQGDLSVPDMSGSQNLNSVESKAAACELQWNGDSEAKDRDALELSVESEECQEAQIVLKSEGAENQSNIELTASEMDRSVLKNFDKSDEASIHLAVEGDGTLETLTVDVQSDYFDKPVVDHEFDRVHGEEEAQLTAELDGRLESSVQDVSLQDQVAEESQEIVLFDPIYKEVSSEELIYDKTMLLEESTNLSVLKFANEAAIDEEDQDLDSSHLGASGAETEIYVPELSHDSGSCLRSEDGDFTVAVGIKLDLTVPCDLDRRVIVKDGSFAGDSSSADDSCSQSNLQFSSSALLDSVDGTKSEVNSVVGEIDVASKTDCDFKDTFKPKSSFGSFECVAPYSQNDNINAHTAVLNRSIDFTTSQSDFVRNSESIVATAEGVISLKSDANNVHSTELDHDKTCAGVVSSEQISTEEVSASPLEESGADSFDGQTVNPVLVRRPFYYLIRIPRFDDVTLSEEIKLTEKEVEKKKQNKDVVRTMYQTNKASLWESKTNLEAAKSKERAAHKLMMTKKRELDSAQSLINLARNAITVEDVDSQIRNMERKIQHGTLNLAEEKRLECEMKQLNQQRKQLAANIRRQQELLQALDRRAKTEERLKVLRKKMDVLRHNHAKAEQSYEAAKKKYDEESALLNDLKIQLSSADTIRQQAYARLQTLKKQAYEKNKLFYKYKDAVKAAYDFAGAGKKDNLEQHCVNQVEKIMKLWNKNDEFRKEYIRCNERSTLRRFKTKDNKSSEFAFSF